MKDLSVTTDYSRYSGDSTKLNYPEDIFSDSNPYAGLKNSLTVSRGRRPGVAFMHKMLQWVIFFAHDEGPLIQILSKTNETQEPYPL